MLNSNHNERKKKNRTLEPVLHATPYLSSMQIDIQLIDKANQLLTGLEKQKLMKSRKKINEKKCEDGDKQNMN